MNEGKQVVKQARTRARRKPVAKDKPDISAVKYEGNTETMVSTGSTLLDLEISAGRVRDGGIPGGILMEVFGPSSTGKTALLCKIAGEVQKHGGETKFKDPEARLSSQFAKMFGYEVDPDDVEVPDTPVEVFTSIREWEPESEGIHGAFVDSTAALVSDLELADKKDEYSRRAKLLSQECRKTCRAITQRNLLVVCSNQIRQNPNAGPFQEKFVTPGGEAVKFYSSLRLRFTGSTKIKRKRKIRGQEVQRTIGITSHVEVYKSSVWRPYGVAPVSIIFNLGIDDVRENLKYLKKFCGSKVYQIGGEDLSNSLSESIASVVDNGREKELRQEVISLWHEVEAEFFSK